MAKRNAYPPGPPDRAAPPTASDNAQTEIERITAGTTPAPADDESPRPTPLYPHLAEALAEVPSRAHGHPLETRALVTKPIVFEVTDHAIEVIKKQYATLPDPGESDEAYEANRKARAHVKGIRVAVEETRKDLKEDALRYGRDVDARAKALRLALEEIENPIDERIKAVDKAKERAKWEAENAERVARERAEAEQRARDQAAEDERLKKQRDAQEVEEKRQREERERLDADRRVVEAEKKKIADAQQAQREKDEAEQRGRQARDDAERAEAERLAKEEADRQEAARRAPDVEKLRAFAKRIRALADDGPELATPAAGEAQDRATGFLMDAAEALETFGARKAGQQ